MTTTQRLKKKLLPVEIVLFNYILIKLLENPTKWYLAYLTLQTVGSKASWQAENLPITSTTEGNSLYSHMLKKIQKKLRNNNSGGVEWASDMHY